MSSTPLKTQQQAAHIEAVVAWHGAQEAQRIAQATLDKANADLSRAFNVMESAAATVAGNRSKVAPINAIAGFPPGHLFSQGVRSESNVGWDPDRIQRTLNEEKQNGST